MEQNEIINRIANSSLITLNLEDLYPKVDLKEIDLKDQLYQGMILREKDIRDFIKNHDWKAYQNKAVAVHCSTDAVVPTWAFMLLGISLQPFASKIVFGNLDELVSQLYGDIFRNLDWKQYQNVKVVIKGCGNVHVPASVFVQVAAHLTPLAASIMYGEPCSTVPLFKKPK